uniref:Uncharacterized protein n=1 Tax=Amphora coffeiformis TaxID=265554 RepID=A0A7S3P5I1_9STRA
MQAPSSGSMSLQEKRKQLQDKARALGDQIHAVSRSRSNSIDDSLVMVTTTATDDSSATPLEKLSLEERLAAAHTEVAALREENHRAAAVEAELRRVGSELKTELLASQEETIVLQTLNDALESKNAVLKEQVKQTEVTLNKSYNDTLDGLTSHIEALESHSKDLQAENDALRAQNEALVAAEKLKPTADTKPLLGPEVEQLRQDYTAVLARVQALEKENEELLAHHLVQENQDLKDQLANLETTLNKSYNDTLMGFTTALQETEDQVKGLQKERDQLRNEVAVAKLKAMRSGSNDASSSNKNNKSSVQQADAALKQENTDLNQEVEDLKQQLQSLETTLNKSYNDTLSSLTTALQETETQFKELETERDTLGFQTTEATRLTRFLQDKCEKLLASSQRDNAQWKEQVQFLQSQTADLEFQRTGALRVTQFLESKCQKLADELRQTKHTHESVKSDLQFQLTEAQRVSKFLQSKCEQLVQAQQHVTTAVVAEETPAVSSAVSMDEDESTTTDEEQVEASRAASVSNDRNVVEDAIGEESADASSPDNHESPFSIAALQERNQQLEESIVQLKEQAQQTEMTLNKSYNETLDGLTAHIEQLEERIRELEEEEEDAAQPMEEHAKQLADLQARVESTKRANKFLREQLDKDEFYTELEAVKRDNRYLAGRVSSLEEQNARLQNDIERFERGEWEYYEHEHSEEGQEEGGEVQERSEANPANAAPPIKEPPQFKDLGDDDSDSSEEEEDPLSTLEKRKLDLTAKIHQPKLGNEQLATSKDEQIEELTEKVGALETRIQTLYTENDELNQVVVEAYAAMEFRQKKIDKEAKLRKFLERKLETTLEEKKAAELVKDDLAFQLTEAKRVSKFLEGKLTRLLEAQTAPEAESVDENVPPATARSVTTQVDESPMSDQPEQSTTDTQGAEEKIRDLESQVVKLKGEARTTEAALNKSYNDTLDSLTSHIQSLDEHIKELDNENDELRFQLTEARRVCQFLQNKFAESDKTHKAAVADVEARVMAALSEKDELSFMVTEAKRLLTYLQNKLIESQQSHKTVITDTQNKLTEAQRVAKYLESKLRKMLEKEEPSSDCVYLGDVVTEDGKQVASEETSEVHSLEKKIKDLGLENSELKFAVTESQRVCAYLQNKLAESEKSSQSVIAEIKFMATEAQRVSKFLESKIHKVVDEKKIAEERAAALVSENSDLRNGMTEAQRVCGYLQNKLADWEKKEQSVLQAAESELAEAQRVSTFLGKKLNKVIAEKQDLMLESESLRQQLTQLGHEISAPTSTRRELSFPSGEADEELTAEDTHPEVEGSDEIDKEDLEARNQELESKVRRLQKELKDAETHLNKSYNDTLDSLTTHIQMVEEHRQELDNENSELRFGLTEAQRVCRFLQEKAAGSEEGRKSLEALVAEKEFKLSDAQRVAKFLESKLVKMCEEKDGLAIKYEEDRRSLEGLVAEKEFKLNDAQRVAKFLESKLVKTCEEKDGLAIKYEEDRRSFEALVAEKEFKLNDAQRVAKFLESKLVKICEEKDGLATEHKELKEQVDFAEKDKNHFKEKAYDLGMRMSALKNESQGLEQEMDKLKAKNSELEDSVTQLKQEVQDTEMNLNKSYNDTLEGLTLHIQEAESRILELAGENEELQRDIAESERVCRTLESKASELDQTKSLLADKDFKLTESQRVSKFLESKLNKIVEEKKTADDRVIELQGQVDKLKMEVATMDMVIFKQKEKLQQSKEDNKDVQSREIIAGHESTPFPLSESVGSSELTDALSAVLSMARTSQRQTEHRVATLKAELADKENLVATLKEELASKENQGEEAASLAAELEEKESLVATLKSELADKEIQIQEYKTNWETEVERNENLSNEMIKLRKARMEQTNLMKKSSFSSSADSKEPVTTDTPITIGFSCVPVRKIRGRPGAGPVYFL